MAPSKRAQLEAQGWTFTAVPHFWPEGHLGQNPATGWKSPGFYDSKFPDAWIATPPDGHPAGERRFDDFSPSNAVKWAWDQAKVLPLNSGLSGIAAIADLMQKARCTGVVAEIEDAPVGSVRADGELLSLCREVLGASRIADRARGTVIIPPEGVRLGDDPAFKASQRLIGEAMRTEQHALALLTELKATTSEGVVAKAKAIGTLWGGRSGKMALVQSLVQDVLAVLGKGSVDA